jgi:hypothetical protein
MKVVNEDGAFVTTTMAIKQLHYMPITPRLKRLFPSEEIEKQMRWHKQEKCDSEDYDIMAHPWITKLETSQFSKLTKLVGNR